MSRKRKAARTALSIADQQRRVRQVQQWQEHRDQRDDRLQEQQQLDNEDEQHASMMTVRLQQAFGDAVLTKAGKVPDASRQLPALLCRTFGTLKYGPQLQGSQATRTRTVTLGLRKFLRPSPVPLGVTAFGIEATFKAVSCYVSRVRVLGSLLANWYFIRELEHGRPLPDANARFFKNCLNAASGVPVDDEELAEAVPDFFGATGLQPRQNDLMATVGETSPIAVTQPLVYQSQEMATAAKNFIEIHYEHRFQTLIKWWLRKTVHALNMHQTATLFTKRVAKITSFLTCFDTRPTAESLLQYLRHLGVHNLYLHLVPLLDLCLSAPLPTATYSAKLTFLLLLQQEHLHADRREWEQLWSEVTEHVPEEEGDEYKKQRKALMSTKWPHAKGPPSEMSPLPKCSNKAAFIRVDQRAIRDMIKNFKGHCKGPWWFSAFAQPHSAQANIPCLRASRRWSSSEAGAFAALTRAGDPEFKCPWFVDTSFLTDGVQVKLVLVTSALDHAGPPGLQQLPSRGYQVSFAPQDLHTALERGTGIVRLEHLHDAPGCLDNVEVAAVDPGQVHIFDAVVADGNKWTRTNAPDLMQNESYRIIYTGDEYREKTLATLSEKQEVLRKRDTPYGAAVAAQMQTRRKTCDLEEYEDYCSTFAAVEEQLWTELLHDDRRLHRFKRYRAVQSTLEDMAERLAPASKGYDRTGKKRVVAFGSAGFKPQKGAASCPRKKFLRVLCCRVLVALTPEGHTTSKCPGCERKTRAGSDYRTRMCTTRPGATPCSLHPLTPTLWFNRDLSGATNIGLRFVYAVYGWQESYAPLDDDIEYEEEEEEVGVAE